jgi:hypothetical protein
MLSIAAIWRSLSQKLRQKYTLKWAAACHNGLGQKILHGRIGARADFVIDRLKARCEPPSPQVECKEVQYQCDFLHHCNIFTIWRYLGPPLAALPIIGDAKVGVALWN